MVTKGNKQVWTKCRPNTLNVKAKVFIVFLKLGEKPVAIEGGKL